MIVDFHTHVFPDKIAEKTIALLDEGATVPFIARYRKEKTGSLDEVQIAAIADEYHRFLEIEDRKATILKTMLAVPDFNVQSKYAAILHDAWLKLPANSWALGGDLDRPFNELPEEEKAKDVQQLMSLYTWLCSLEPLPNT